MFLQNVGRRLHGEIIQKTIPKHRLENVKDYGGKFGLLCTVKIGYDHIAATHRRQRSVENWAVEFCIQY
jgi:hypothetical protein